MAYQDLQALQAIRKGKLIRAENIRGGRLTIDQVLLQNGSQSTVVGPDGIRRGGEDVYLHGETLYFTSSGTFTKADYPGGRALLVECQGPGGGGGGAATTSGSQGSFGDGGGGGEYAKSLLLFNDLSDSETVTVGPGGTAGTVGNAGSAGGSPSSFGSHMMANPGAGGGTVLTTSTQIGAANDAPNGGSGGTGDLLIPGGPGGRGMIIAAGPTANQVVGGVGGLAFLGLGAQWINFGSGAGGQNYGSGGAGAGVRNARSGQTGGVGANGIVIVELLY